MLSELEARALDMARTAGAVYADVRCVTAEEERVAMRNGRPDDPGVSMDSGYGIRVLVDGYWGFASTPGDDVAGVADTVMRAVAGAKAAARARGPRVERSAGTPQQGRWVTETLTDPFKLPVSVKLELLARVHDAATRERRVRSVQGLLTFRREERRFASTEGHDLTQVFTDSGATLAVFAMENGEVERRTYPNSLVGDTAHRGFEFIEAMDLPRQAGRLAEEACALLYAPRCPETVTDLVVGSAQLALQIHESCGHATEADRTLGWETSFTGTSFLTPDLVGRFRYGSPHVNLVADPTVPGGLGSFWYDDEGTPARKVDLVRDGILVGLLTSRETAPIVGIPNTGAARADGWSYEPLVFMTNINLEPGDVPLEELIGGVEAGVLMDMNRSWSIDAQRLNFRFGTEVGYEIKHGKLGRLLRGCSYTARTPDFWRACDGVADGSTWHLWGMPCGKGEPKQWGFIGHGCSAARFRGIRVGGAV